MIELFNKLSIVLDLRVVVFPPQYATWARTIRGKDIDWSLSSHEAARLYDGGLAFGSDHITEQYRALFNDHREVQRIIFFYHNNADPQNRQGGPDHWTIFEHEYRNGSTSASNVTCYDSLSAHTKQDIQDQVLLREYYNWNRDGLVSY